MKKRYAYLSLLRVIACFAVILIHTCLAAQSALNLTPEETIATAILKNVSLWAAPCFIMVTGALLLSPGRTISLKKLYGRYILRAVVMLAVFTLLFHLVDLRISGEDVGWREAAGAYLRKLLTGGSWAHMWYLYMLLALYLLLPAYRIIAAGATDRVLRYLLLVAFLFLSVIPAIEVMTDRQSAFYINEQYIYPFYLFAGYAVHEGILKLGRRTAGLLAAASTAALMTLTVIGVRGPAPVLISLLGRYSFPVTVLQTISVFALCSSLVGEEMPAGGFLRRLDGCTFGMYLLHLLLIKLLFVVGEWDPYLLMGWPGLVLTALGVFAASFAVVLLIRLLPGMKRWL